MLSPPDFASIDLTVWAVLMVGLLQELENLLFGMEILPRAIIGSILFTGKTPISETSTLRRFYVCQSQNSEVYQLMYLSDVSVVSGEQSCHTSISTETAGGPKAPLCSSGRHDREGANVSKYGRSKTSSRGSHLDEKHL
jgi:hypothetical protein